MQVIKWTNFFYILQILQQITVFKHKQVDKFKWEFDLSP